MDNFEIVWLTDAINDLSQHLSFLKNVNVNSSKELLNEIKVAVEGLKNFPERNPVFQMPKNFPVEIRKQIVSKRYLSLYSIEAGNIIIYRVLDCRKGFEYII